MNNNQIDKYFDKRATVRRFKPEAPDALFIAELVRKAGQAPTTGGMQLYTVIETRSPEGRARLAPAHFNQPACTGAPVLLTFCIDLNRFSRWCELSDAQPGYDNFQTFVYAGLDTAIFAQQFVTLAELAGLGTCYLGTTTYNAPAIAEALNLPRLVVPLVTVAVGWPEEQPAPSWRLPVEGVLASESYPETDDSRILGMYAGLEQLDSSRKFIVENNKQTLAQVFTDIRYTREANEHFSKIFADFIDRQGFGLPK